MMKKFLLASTLLFYCSSCCLQSPDCYSDLELPDSWRIEENESSVIANVRWWEQFHDPYLNGYIWEGIYENRDLRIALARVIEFEATYKIISSDLFPQLTYSGFATRSQISTALTPLPPGVSRFLNIYNIQTNLFYDLDIWGKIKASSEAAYQDLLAQEEIRRFVILTVTRDIAASYVQLLQIDKQIEISERTIESRLFSLKIAESRFKNGLTSELEVRQAQTEVENARAALNTQITAQAFTENALSALLGRPSGDIARGRLDDLTMVSCIPTGLPSDLIFNRPDIIEYEHRLCAANARIWVARAAFLPDFNLTGHYGAVSPRLHDLLTNRAEFWDINLNFLGPIFLGGKLVGGLNLSIAVQREMLYTYEQRILRALEDVNDTLIAFQQAKSMMEIQERRIYILKDYLRLATLQHNNGQTDYLNVLDAERNLFNASLDYAQAQGNSFGSLIRMYAALGGGWVIDLAEVTPCP